MPEIKHTFTAGKMNKDLDERLVPNGQYREALNVQVRTTDSDSDGVGNAGVIQNIEGNVALENAAYKTTGYDGSVTKMVASVSDEKNDPFEVVFFNKKSNNIDARLEIIFVTNNNGNN